MNDQDSEYMQLAFSRGLTDRAGNVLGMFFSVDSYPVEVGKKFWTNDLRVVTITALGKRDQDYSDTGERQVWHKTTDGIFDTLTGHMRQYGRLVRYYSGAGAQSLSFNQKDAESYPDGTSYGDVR